MESSTFKSLTSNSARNISRRLNPLKVQRRIPQHTEDMLHFQLSPMRLPFEQFVLQTLSNFRASHHCSHVPTPFSWYPSWMSALHLFHSVTSELSSLKTWTQCHHESTASDVQPNGQVLCHCPLLSSLQGIAQAAGGTCYYTEAQRSPLPSVSHQQPNTVPGVCSGCYKMRKDSSPQLSHFSLYLCLLGFYLLTLDWNEAMQHWGSWASFQLRNKPKKGISTKCEVLQDLGMWFISVPLIP